MADNIPHNALVVVADGTGARFFRNAGHGNMVSLSADGEFNPTDLLNDGPAGKRPKEIGKTLTKASVAEIQNALN